MKENITHEHNLNSPHRSSHEHNLWSLNFKTNILITIKMLGFLSIGFIVWFIAAVITVKFITII